MKKSSRTQSRPVFLHGEELWEGMNFKALLDYGHGLEMSEKQARAIKEQKKLAQVAEVQTVN